MERGPSEFLQEATNPDGAPSGVAPSQDFAKMAKESWGQRGGEGLNKAQLSASTFQHKLSRDI